MDGGPGQIKNISCVISVGFWNGARALSACHRCVARRLCVCGPRGYIGSRTFMHPYVCVVGPSKHDILLVLHVPTRCEISTISSRSRTKWFLLPHASIIRGHNKPVKSTVARSSAKVTTGNHAIDPRTSAYQEYAKKGSGGRLVPALVDRIWS